MTPASWPSSQRDSPRQSTHWEGQEAALPGHSTLAAAQSVETELGLPVLLLLGSLWGQGHPSQQSDSSGCPLCCLGCSKPGEIQAVSSCLALQSSF